jgi:hypothetical protein
MLKHIVCQKVEALFNKAFREGGSEIVFLSKLCQRQYRRLVTLFTK